MTFDLYPAGDVVHRRPARMGEESPDEDVVVVEFEDFLPSMARKLGAEGLIAELCKGFQLLMDPGRDLITFESLKANAATLGLQGLGDEELMGMLREGDLDGDGALDQMEFCILMFRLSPELMEGSQRMLEHAMGWSG